MIFLVDGHNLIGKMPDIDLGDPDDEARLVLRLLNWATVGKNRRVIVVFDRGLPGPQWFNLSSERLKVVFMPEGRSADSWLVAFLKEIRNPQEYTLVSSDRAIARAARQRRITHQNSEQFAAQLAEDWRAAQAQAAAEAAPPPTDLSPSEVDEWLTLFGGERDVNIRPYRRPPAPPVSPTLPPVTPTTQPDPHDFTLSPQEVAEWLTLFGGEPSSPSKPAARSQHTSRRASQPPKQTRDPRLSAEDIELWRSLFGDKDTG